MGAKRKMKGPKTVCVCLTLCLLVHTVCVCVCVSTCVYVGMLNLDLGTFAG